MTEDQAIASLSAISSPTRLRMLRALVAAGGAGLAAGAIAEKVGATPSRASFHLANLADAGLVTSERVARQITYFANFEAMGALIRYLVEDCCRNDARVIGCCPPGGGDRDQP